MSEDPERFKAGAAGFREYGIPFWVAVTLLEHGELAGDRALLDERAGSSRGWGRRPGSSGSTEPRAVRPPRRPP